MLPTHIPLTGHLDVGDFVVDDLDKVGTPDSALGDETGTIAFFQTVTIISVHTGEKDVTQNCRALT